MFYRTLVLNHRYGRCGFVLGLIFFLSLNSCVALESAAGSAVSELYEGLKKQHEITGAIPHFEKALNSSNAYIAAAAAAELMNLHSDGENLSAGTMVRIRQKLSGEAAGKVAGSWVRALEALDKGNVPSLLLSGDSRSLDEAALYAQREWRRTQDHTAENAAIDGRFAVSRSRYGEALLSFRIVLRDSPELFFRYPDLLTDLGRSFQYTATGSEGIDLFLKMEETIPEYEAYDENLIRFRLLFFAARIARQRDKPQIELFERALPFAAEISPEQADACIWYILDTSVPEGTDKTIQYLETYISQWHDDAYFFDVLDKLSRELVLKRQWEDVLRVFALLRDRSGMATAKLAWIIGRVIEEGFLSPAEIRRAHDILLGGMAANMDVQALAKAYIHLTYNKTSTVNAVYYRALSSASIGEPFLAELAEEPSVSSAGARKGRGTVQRAGRRTVNSERQQELPEVMQFLLGFFTHDAAEFAPRQIRAMESDLSPEELRSLAEALGKAGQYQESMRLVSLYARGEAYQPTRQDLELWYPRPFEGLVEQYAQETGIDPALLYGLIRMESAFNSDVVSRAGAVGLTQLMPATAEETAARIRRRGGPDYRKDLANIEDTKTAGNFGLDLRDPAVNIHLGAAYLAYLDERMGDTLLALLAYNGGMTRVRRWHRATNNYTNVTSLNLPPDLFLETIEYPETRNYGRNVIAAASMYKELYYK